ncbi:hypothetical protein Taro_027809 [Colocasia esculenta]|uniref:Uncharacterized protein n=1 Tax=Colocasia esculenta TaxID=4460 RepID=A0A843VNK6_COLES|nr:hypothetical protein [Colocasia esculenta]
MTEPTVQSEETIRVVNGGGFGVCDGGGGTRISSRIPLSLVFFTMSEGAVGPEEEDNVALPLLAPPSMLEDLRATMEQVEEAFQGEDIASVDNGSLSNCEVMDILFKVENYMETLASETTRLIGVSDEELMKERMEVKPPPQQKMERMVTMAKEHKDALERAVSLNIPHAVAPEEEPTRATEATTSENQSGATSRSDLKSSGRPNWDELVKNLFERSNSGALVLKEDIKAAS